MNIKIDHIAQAVESLFESQLRDWELAKNNYQHLDRMICRAIELDGLTALLQYNPERIRSTTARIDDKSLKERICFLCDQNRPTEQAFIEFGNEYRILVNPFPIFQKHLTIAAKQHTLQNVITRFDDLMLLAQALPKYLIFYNGPKCGASAPDHMHFQAGNKDLLPLQKYYECLLPYKQEICSINRSCLFALKETVIRGFIIESANLTEARRLFEKIYHAAQELQPQETEPMMNLICWFDQNQWYIVIIFRKSHRPTQFYEKGDKNILISPGSAEMGGLFVLSMEKDYQKLTGKDLRDILDQVTLTRQQMYQIIQQL